jgi:MoaA/NifB/PqqE/SkfB family radical SAM enzyme
MSGKPMSLFKKKTQLASQYHTHKREALESFFEFAEGGPMPKWPLELFLEVSNICDLKCAMCPTFSALNPDRQSNIKDLDRGLIAYEKVTEPLESLLEHAIMVHAFGYGEPTIHPQFREMIEYVSQFEVMIDFFTHGMHLTEEMCEFLVEKRVVRITMSFSGATQEEYENVYLGGDFERVVSGIKRLTAAKEKAKSPFPQIEVNSLGFIHHVDKFVDFVHLMGGAGVNRVNLKPLQTYDLMPELHRYSSIMRPDVEGKIIEEAKEVAAQYGLEVASGPYEQTVEAFNSSENVREARSKRHKGVVKMVGHKMVEITDLKEYIKSDEKKERMERMRSFRDVRLSHAEEPSEGDREYFNNRKTPCMEPFKTFYACYDGPVFPCCFKTTRSSLTGEQIWNGEDYTEIREHILKGQYPKDMCQGCVKAQTYPKHHHLDMKVSQYQRWFQQSFGVPFHTHILQQAKELHGNEEILARHQSTEVE